MLILRDANGITIKRHAESVSYVRIGILTLLFYAARTDSCGNIIGDRTFNGGEFHKPHDSFTISDCACLLEQLEKFHTSLV